MPIAKELIDPDADKILRRLKRSGHLAYLVGGCVRDLLLGRTPKDFDIATGATPNEIKDLFRNSRIIGRRFRLAHIFFGQKIIETATFRANPREGAPVDENEEILIRRDNVFGTAEEDARRRDFTINGLFYDIEAGEVTDHVGGLADLEARLVRTIGDPEIRFREDPVRILRAIKFAARLGFDMEPATYAALLAHRGELPKCAPPRVLEEVYRLLRGGAARRSMELLLQTGVAHTLAPELVWMFGTSAPAPVEVPVEPADESLPVLGLLPPGDKLDECRGRAWRVLDEIDNWSPGGRIAGTHPRANSSAEAPLTNALLLAALVAPFVPESTSDVEPPLPEEEPPHRRRKRPAPPAEGPREQPEQLDYVLGPLVQRLRVSRRDAERARQILLTQRRLSPGRRRRARPMMLVKRDYFGEALALFEILTTVRDQAGDDSARWRALWRTAQTEGPAPAAAAAPAVAPAPDPEDPVLDAAAPGDPADALTPAHRRRRRRGGRRRRRPDGTGIALAVGDSAQAAPPPGPDDGE